MPLPSSTRASACYHAASPVLARMLRDDLATTYGAAVPSALACLQDDFEACIVRLRFPLAHRRSIRTTNLLERLFGEERRPTEAILHAFGERAVPSAGVKAMRRLGSRRRHETSDICFAGNRAVDSVDFEKPGHDTASRRERGISITVTSHW